MRRSILGRNGTSADAIISTTTVAASASVATVHTWDQTADNTGRRRMTGGRHIPDAWSGENFRVRDFAEQSTSLEKLVALLPSR